MRIIAMAVLILLTLGMLAQAEPRHQKSATTITFCVVRKQG